MSPYCKRTSVKQLLSCCNTLKVQWWTSRGQHEKTEHDVYIDRSDTNFFEGEPLQALSTLAYSDNVDLQRSAALAFAEITEKDVRQVGRDTLDPILFLLQSHDVEVQRAASAALGNLAVNSKLADTGNHTPEYSINAAAASWE